MFGKKVAISDSDVRSTNHVLSDTEIAEHIGKYYSWYTDSLGRVGPKRGRPVAPSMREFGAAVRELGWVAVGISTDIRWEKIPQKGSDAAEAIRTQLAS
ncbi:hypothetical protein [Compostimonas suwonensis]|uniref:Uncharacterized protein n=1 Tax=Compostimonas suwonensis TaxID=1048394 RepID=A0A2M9C4M8_9MICO|nr:hypothetical protein [Compostimonas suwonensis]PJJ65449.1 hypothetical protein CLV54_0482 [Compostimonas suwonensis]